MSFSVSSHNHNACGEFFREAGMGECCFLLNISPEILLESGKLAAEIALMAPCWGVLMKGRKKRLAKGSTHECMVIMSESTIPGSAALTAIPRGCNSCASLAVYRVRASFDLLYALNRLYPCGVLSKNEGSIFPM